jgi:CMP-N-acetylneuraminic acid synthetase
MYNEKKILAIIPARGGSKGLPGKNIKSLLGKPLIGWTIEQAKASKYIDEIFVSTDSREIADVAENFGISVPFLRPKELASDTSPSSEFVLHTINYYRNKDSNFDYILLLEPTSPLRKKKDIDKAIELLKEGDNSIGVVSLGEVHTEHPNIVKYVSEDGKILPFVNNQTKVTHRQSLSKAYFPYGVVYLVKTEYFEKEMKFYEENTTPYFIERWQNYEVDDIFDFLCIESILNYKKEDII